MPFTDYAAGNTLTAASLDIIMRQTIMSFSSNSARDTALASVLAEGLFAYMTDSPNRLMYYDGSAWRYVHSEGVAWTPTWTNLTVGSGTVVAAYGYVGPFLWWQISLSLNSTTVGTNPSFVIPNSHASVGSNQGSMSYSDVSAGQAYTGSWSVGNTQTSCSLVSSSGFVTATSPYTWANGDIMTGSGLIRIV